MTTEGLLSADWLPTSDWLTTNVSLSDVRLWVHPKELTSPATNAISDTSLPCDLVDADDDFVALARLTADNLFELAKFPKSQHLHLTPQPSAARQQQQGGNVEAVEWQWRALLFTDNSRCTPDPD